jgi:DNA polymerase-3 subunit delta'
MAEEEASSVHPRIAVDLVGQEAAEAQFLAAYAAGRLPHAWLITGPRGVGKATLAYRIARFVLSQRSAEEDAGGLFGDALPNALPTSLHLAPDHPIFRRVAASGHSDLRVYERTSDKKSIPVEIIRDVRTFLSLTPGEGEWRVVIIDSADDLNPNSANAVLKILEEPPARALLLLVSHEPGGLLPTIRSRCRQLRLHPLKDDVLRRLLRERMSDLSAEDIELLIALSEGSIGRALRLAGKGGIELFRDVSSLVGAVPHLDIASLHKLGDKVSRDTSGETMRTLGELLDWIMVRVARNAAGIGTDAAPGVTLPRPSSASLDRWMDVWEKTRTAFGEAEALNLDKKQLVLETFLAIEDAAR